MHWLFSGHIVNFSLCNNHVYLICLFAKLSFVQIIMLLTLVPFCCLLATSLVVFDIPIECQTFFWSLRTLQFASSRITQSFKSTYHVAFEFQWFLTFLKIITDITMFEFLDFFYQFINLLRILIKVPFSVTEWNHVFFSYTEFFTYFVNKIIVFFI